MLRVTLLAAAATMLACGAAPAAPAVLFENTIKVEMTDGRSGTVKANADGTFTADIPGMGGEGTWADEGEKTCFVVAGETAKNCAVYPADLKVGGSITDDNGNMLTIVAGR